MKKCKIFYATVVQSKMSDEINSKLSEPVKIWGFEPLGKEPEYCCEDFATAVSDSVISISNGRVEFIKWIGNSGSGYKDIAFCPFCSAKIVFEPHLKIRQVVIIREVEERHYEVFK